METLTSQQLRHKYQYDIHPVVHHLLDMDKRIRIYPLFGDVQENKGFFLTKKNIYFPYMLPAIQHDLSHLLELTNSDRWTMTDWGMPRFNEDFLKPAHFFAALSRETRTRAIQLHLTRFNSEEEKLNSTSYNQLNNSYWADMTRKLLPFGRFRSYQDVETWIASLRERTYKAWSLGRIIHEWKVRLNHIQHWMETCPS